MSTKDITETADEANTWDPALTTIEQAKALHAEAGFMASITITTLDGGDPILTAAAAREWDVEIDQPSNLHIEIAVNFGQVFRADGTEDFAARRPLGDRDTALALLGLFPMRVFLLDPGMPKAKAALVRLVEQAAEVTLSSM